MAKQEKADRFAAYLMAIVQNVGMTVTLQILDRNFDGSHAPRSEEFQDRLVKRSRELSLVIAKEWEFPESVLEAIDSQASTKHCKTLGKILYVGDKFSKMHILSGQGRLKGELDQVACRFRGRLTDVCKVCFESLSD
jgi:HD-like signal output (HDOD) protein